MGKFNVGDRASYYHSTMQGGMRGTVMHVHSDGTVIIKLDRPWYSDLRAHPKQCRKLRKVKRERRELIGTWVPPQDAVIRGVKVVFVPEDPCLDKAWSREALREVRETKKEQCK